MVGMHAEPCASSWSRAATTSAPTSRPRQPRAGGQGRRADGRRPGRPAVEASGRGHPHPGRPAGRSAGAPCAGPAARSRRCTPRAGAFDHRTGQRLRRPARQCMRLLSIRKRLRPGRCPRLEGRQVVRLHMVGDDHDLDLAGVQHGGRAHVVDSRRGHRAAVAVDTVAEAAAPGRSRCAAGPSGRWPACRACRPATAHVWPDAGVHHLLHRCRVEDGKRGHVLSPASRMRPAPSWCPWCRPRRSCRCGPAAPPGRCPAAGRRQGLGAPSISASGSIAVDELLARRPGHVQQLVAPARARRVVVGHHHGRQPGIGDVGIREADEHRGAQRALLPSRGSGPAARGWASRRCPGASRAAASAGGPRPWPAARGRPAAPAPARPARRPVSNMSMCG
jgi:hypothetical protein